MLITTGVETPGASYSHSTGCTHTVNSRPWTPQLPHNQRESRSLIIMHNTLTPSRDRLPVKKFAGQRITPLLLPCSKGCPGTVAIRVQLFITEDHELMAFGTCDYCFVFRSVICALSELQDIAPACNDEEMSSVPE